MSGDPAYVDPRSTGPREPRHRIEITSTSPTDAREIARVIRRYEQQMLSRTDSPKESRVNRQAVMFLLLSAACIFNSIGILALVIKS